MNIASSRSLTARWKIIISIDPKDVGADGPGGKDPHPHR